jgi:hypothetical protein
MIASLAWSDLIVSGEVSHTGGRGRRRQYTATCCVPGCNGPGLDRNMCGTHARSFYRTGHPLGAVVRDREKFVDAVLDWYEVETRASLVSMLAAARAFGERGRPAPYPPRGSVRVLIRAARRYAEAETDAQYRRARNALEAAATEWVRGKVVAHRNKAWRERRAAKMAARAA